jgi:hypothetical protein
VDNATIHRLMVICKNHYVLRTIDDLFILAGADLNWCIKRAAPQGKSEREDGFNCWLYGIRDKAPQREDAIFWKVANEVVRNPEIPKQQRQALTEALDNAARVEVSDKEFQLEPFLATLARMLASAGLTREVAVVTFAEPVLNLLENDWGQEYYTLYLHVPQRLYTQIETERKRCEKNISDRVDDLFRGIPGPRIHSVEVVPQIVGDDKWREKAIAWLAGEKINNQGRVRSDNVAPRVSDGLLFRSQPEIYLYQALKATGVLFAPLPVFVRGGEQYRRIEPDFVIVKSGVVMVVEVDGDTYHHETPAEADNRTLMIENEGVYVLHVSASDCRTPDLAAGCAKRILDRIGKLKDARR